MRNVLTIWMVEDPAAAVEPRTCTLCNVCRRVSCGLPRVLRSSPLLVVSSFTAGWGCPVSPVGSASLSVCVCPETIFTCRHHANYRCFLDAYVCTG
jgi:hypothetical protein